MCGIFAITDPTFELPKQLSEQLGVRGKDGHGIVHTKHFTLAHTLHAVIGHVKQPLQQRGAFIGNCEIYNYKELNAKHNLNTKNDAETLFHLLEADLQSIRELDGDYAFVYADGDILHFARDPVGVKPLFYGQKGERFAIASEKKMLHSLGFSSEAAKPGVLYRWEKHKLHQQPYHIWEMEQKQIDEQKAAKQIHTLFVQAIKKRATTAAVFFSGGVDSTYIAYELKRAGCKIDLYTVAYSDGNLTPSKDLLAAQEAAKLLDLPLKEILVGNEEVHKALPFVLHAIEQNDPIKVGVALTLHLAAQHASRHGHKVAFSGLGAEELFGGYRRHMEAKDVAKECLVGLEEVHVSDLYRDDVICQHNALELRVPFLDKDLIAYALTIPGEMKIVESVRKYILRKAALHAGLPEVIAMRPKLAAQYGSNIQKAFERLSKSYPTIRAYFADRLAKV